MNAFELFGTISINGDKAERELDKISEKGKSLATTLGRGFAAAGKAVLTGVAAGAAAIGALSVASVKHYAEYEQLVGGVETLFKESGTALMNYAKDAYKNAGLSANEYMSTVTSFSASLIQSLGNDTASAVEYANMALVDMSDNANKMGTDMTLIQNAYQGFAKQNYTMLDNLKLGYGGTQTEMKRLLKDAQKIQKEHGKTVEYSIDSFADIVEAVHVVQEEMGIAGTTTEEAATTIQGSVGMMKAAWVNFLTGMADSKQDFNALTTNLVNSVITVANNIVPRLIETVPRLVEGLGEIGRQLATYLPEIVSSLLPAIISGVSAIISGVATQIPALLTAVGDAISTAWTNSVWPMIQNLFTAWFGVELPSWGTVKQSISDLWTKVKKGIDNFFSVVFSVFTPDEDGTSIAAELSEWWELVLSALGDTISAIFSIFTEDEDGMTVGERLKKWWNKVLAALGTYISAVFSVFTPDEDGTSVAEEIKTWWKKVLGVLGDFISSVFSIKLPSPQAIIDKIKNWWEGIKSSLGLTVDASVKTSASGHVSGSGGGRTSTYVSGGGMGVKPKVTFNAAGTIFSKPTLFDTRLGYQVVGEAGPEAVAPISVLQGYVSDAVAKQNAGLVNALDRVVDAITDMNENMGSNLRAALDDTSLKINNREFGRLVRTVT